jgi:CelD/BcsL family acetyltransferase involved in cellulose biosynthesis
MTMSMPHYPQRLMSQGSPIRLEWLTDEQRLRALAKPWRSISVDPFTSPDWLLPWWEAFSDGRRLLTCAAWRGDDLVALLPMAEQRGRLESLSNAHTPYFDIATTDDRAREAVLGALVGLRHDCVVFDQLPRDRPTAGWLLSHRRGRIAVTRARQVSPIVDTSVGLEAFRAASRPRWGAPLDRFRRKMIRDHTASFELLTQPNDVDGPLDRGFAVEASGWKGKAGTAILSDSRTEWFYRTVAHAFADQGQLALSWLCFGEEMVAFDLDLLVDGRLYLLKTGFDERYRRLAPGLVLRLAVIERCIEMGLSAHELLGDDSEWKRKFAGSARSHLEVRMYRRSARGTTSWTYRSYMRPVLRRLYTAARRRIG